MLPFDWIIGFVWGNGTITDYGLRIQYRNKALLQLIANSLQSKNALKLRQYENKMMLLIPMEEELTQTLLSWGWSGRKDKHRQYPQGDISHLHFIKGYCYTKACISSWTYKSRKGVVHTTPSLRIFGGAGVIRQIDDYFVANLDTTPKRIYRNRCMNQTGHVGECHYLQYLSKKEVPRLIAAIETEELSKLPAVKGI
ncbi:hypothetical protein [Acetonema longum]|uniref:DOD-type homing endonuclease domain-containing protein n=1 Tax=Acetonema longum DSM 6540 TaxID=1009370 RepID=F7NHK2_9FIRM|nr:hypothetical protein [Acetonema longum]EGO64377.1 hypothetical protein ALO_07748 [Acetonema longum DSM 6540]